LYFFPQYRTDPRELQLDDSDIRIKRFDVPFRLRMGDPTLLLNAFLGAILLFLEICYTFVNSKIFELFTCTGQIDGTYSLTAAPCTWTSHFGDRIGNSIPTL
jgi:hypothetical protein